MSNPPRFSFLGAEAALGRTVRAGDEQRELRRRFPQLYRELIAKRHSIAINSCRTSIESDEEENCVGERESFPDAVDYIRRCSIIEEAEAVINFLENRNEISTDYAESLRRQLRERGLASFGSRKQWGYYSGQRKG